MMTEVAPYIPVHLPKPHGKQRGFMRSEAKRKVIVAGRRGGKTTGAAMLAVEALLKGRRVLEAAPTADQTGAFWTACIDYLADLLNAGIVYKNESNRVIELGEGRIKTKTAHNADTLRGDYADLLILDEYAFMKPDAWDKVGAPMLLDNDGDAVFIFTPNRKNHAFQLFARAQSDDSGRWGAWHFTSFDNPHLSRAALDEITSDQTEESYQQEVLARFLENEGAVFRNIAANLYHPPTPPDPDDHAGHALYMGVDWGKQNDYTVASVVCDDCAQEVELYRDRGSDYSLMRRYIQDIYTRWEVGELVAETNAMGEPNVEELERAGLHVIRFTTTATSKPPLIESLVLALEREEVAWLDLPYATAELEAYERKVNHITGRSTYSAPEGMNDDTVMGRALALYGITNKAWGVL